MGPGDRATSNDEAGDGRGPRRRLRRRSAGHSRAGGLLGGLAELGTAQRGGIGELGLQGAEAGVDRPESLSLGIHDGGKAESEPLRVAKTKLVDQALGVGQGDGGRALRGGVLETREDVRVASQERAVCDQSGSMFGLGASCLREGGRRDQPSSRTRRGRGGLGVG
jgi:hypothetical protein